MAASKEVIEVEVDGRAVRVTSPSKVYFPQLGLTKKDLVDYYIAAGEAALRGVYNRPVVLKRYVRGIDKDFFFQKRAPDKRPDWIDTVTLRFPSGRTAEELVVTSTAAIVWATNLGNIDLNPHPVRADDLAHPDELRIDLDPTPGVDFVQVREVALVAREVLEEHGLVPFPKTSGSRGIHVNCRIERRWSFPQVRDAARAVAVEVSRRAPDIATSRWFKEQRHGVFLDFNQNAKDRTVASEYSVRPLPAATVSAPLVWDEVPTCEIADYTIATMPARLAELGDLNATMDDHPGSLDSLLELAAEQAERGADDRAPSPMPLLTIARADDRDEALDGLERWKARYPEAASHLQTSDILVDAMRGRSTTWTRIRVNLRRVPERLRPAQEPPDPDLPAGDWRLPKSER